uniref:Colicin V production protein n=1 Tax=Candidatus Aschnera chinzeii TaxID=1485666 RepID=A0AAT9G4X4_9ENTR|nr:MAG: colicin V production protein [Candidatus Aschnera chinzeii]
MIWIDWIIITAIGISMLFGIMRGFIKECLSLIILITAFLITNKFYIYFSNYFNYFKSTVIRYILSIIILFIITIFVGNIIINIIHSIILRAKLTYTDRTLGLCFGIIRGIVIVTILLFIIFNYTSLSNNYIWKNSKLLPYFNYIILYISNYLKYKLLI